RDRVLCRFGRAGARSLLRGARAFLRETVALGLAGAPFVAIPSIEPAPDAEDQRRHEEGPGDDADQHVARATAFLLEDRLELGRIGLRIRRRRRGLPEGLHRDMIRRPACAALPSFSSRSRSLAGASPLRSRRTTSTNHRRRRTTRLRRTTTRSLPRRPTI